MLLGDDEDSLALVFQHVKPEDAGLYTCVAKTSTGNISCSAELTVQGTLKSFQLVSTGLIMTVGVLCIPRFCLTTPFPSEEGDYGREPYMVIFN